jgi:small redox-active disulfide protein 2
MAWRTGMRKVQILGTGCVKREKLREHAEEAVAELGEGYEIEKISDIEEIVDFGVMMTPALAIDGEVKVVGKVISKEEIIEMLEDE